MKLKPKTAPATEVVDADLARLIARHKKRVERRAKYLATLTPQQRLVRDRYVAYVRWWRDTYKDLVENIKLDKAFCRAEGHNDLKALKARRAILAGRRHEAHSMLLARLLSKGLFIADMTDLAPPPEPVVA